ncbi:MAG: helix-turn-helix domain-containing protein [Reyranella sp.]|uniref:helix-turn-helix domain-containing protein n=1 Tax=Reyranella sp. TaxID=1929291 RepID=UPI003D0DFE8D
MPDQVDWRAIERDASSGRAVGRLLRDQREARGLALSDIEKALRIRRSNLEAIEEGRFDKLPGAAYVPAFLRAYASHVGLDPEKVLTAYHHSGAVPIKRPVALPADFPIGERRAPVGLAVLTVLLVVAAGYAAWHYLPREQAVVAEKVPPVPDRLLASRPDAAPTGSTSPPTAGTPSTNATSPSQPTREVRSSPPAAQPAELWPAMRRDSVAPPTQPESQPAPLAPPIVVQVPAPPAVMTVPAIGQAQAAQPPIQVDTPKPATPAPATEEAVAKPAAPDPATSNIPVKVDTPVRVRANSWVELRSPTGDVLAQTYVRAGESYTVPAGIAYRIINAR